MNFLVVLAVVTVFVSLVYRVTFDFAYNNVSGFKREAEIVLYTGEAYSDYPKGARSYESFTEYLELNPKTGELQVAVPELRGLRLSLRNPFKALQISNGYLHFAGYPQLRLCGNINPERDIGTILSIGGGYEGQQHCGIYRKGDTIFKCVTANNLDDVFNAMKVLLASKQNLSFAQYFIPILGMYLSPSAKRFEIFLESEYMNRGSLAQVMQRNDDSLPKQYWEAFKRMMFGLLRSPLRVFQIDNHGGNFFVSQKPDGSVRVVIGDITWLSWNALNVKNTSRLGVDDSMRFLEPLLGLLGFNRTEEVTTAKQIFDVLRSFTLKTNHTEPLNENEMYYIDYAIFISCVMRLLAHKRLKTNLQENENPYPDSLIALKRVFDAPKVYYQRLFDQSESLYDYPTDMMNQLKTAMPAAEYAELDSAYRAWLQS